MLLCLQGTQRIGLFKEQQENIMRTKMFSLCFVFVFLLTAFFGSANAIKKENMSSYQVKIVPLTSMEIPFDFSDIVIKY